MLDTDKSEFVKTLMGLAAIKPGGNMLTKESYEIWWNAMRDWPIEEFKSAASHLAKAVEFMPSPFQFNQLRKAQEHTPGEAWAIALSACKRWRNPDDLPKGRVAEAVRAIGGWKALAMADTEKDNPFLERRFSKAYEQLQDVEDARLALPHFSEPNQLEHHE